MYFIRASAEVTAEANNLPEIFNPGRFSSAHAKLQIESPSSPTKATLTTKANIGNVVHLDHLKP